MLGMSWRTFAMDAIQSLNPMHLPKVCTICLNIGEVFLLDFLGGFSDVRSHPKSRHRCCHAGGLLRAMCGRLRVGKAIFASAVLVGAAMCSAFGCGAEDRWP
jgi:hypothetical protein